jgi:Family of unknown function (DUF6328)
MSLQRKLKNALDETRLLILGAQVLFGFQFNGIFQDTFRELPAGRGLIACTSLVLIMLAIGLLIAPSMQHRIVEGGNDTPRIVATTTTLAAAALFPVALALGLDLFLAIERALGFVVGIVAGVAFFILAIGFWYLLEILLKKRPAMPADDHKPTPLSTKVEQMLTEARVIIPGAQALLGFQLTVTLMRAFEQLPFESKLLHAAALGCVALAVILLMAPAALHRIAFGGEDDPEFLAIGSVFVIVAPIPLALGIALDTYVAIAHALESRMLGALLAAATTVVLAALWYAYPLMLRQRLAGVEHRDRRSHAAIHARPPDRRRPRRSRPPSTPRE